MRQCSRCGAGHARRHSCCQPCHTAYQRAYRRRPGVVRKRDRAQESAYMREYQKRPEVVARRRSEPYRLKERARELLRYHVRAGNIDRPARCERCGNAASCQGHHHDYSRPLDVEWLCVPCHAKAHPSKEFG